MQGQLSKRLAVAAAVSLTIAPARQRHMAVAVDEVCEPTSKRGKKTKTETKTSCPSRLVVFG